MKKLGNTSFHEESIKKMTFKDFNKTYSKILKGVDLKEAYEELTGKKAKAEKPEPPENTKEPVG